jgi:hypothetical protein
VAESDALALPEWLRAQLDEDEAWALAASAPYPYAAGNPTTPPGGVHWEWIGGRDWEPARVDPVTDEFVTGPDGSWAVNLGSVETWPSGVSIEPNPRQMRATIANEMVEVLAGPAGHIVRHDPARALREVEAKRRLLEEHAIMWRDIGWLETVDGVPDEVYAELPVCNRCVPKHSYYQSLADVPEGPCLSVRLLTLPFESRPGYRSEWAP